MTAQAETIEGVIEGGKVRLIRDRPLPEESHVMVLGDPPMQRKPLLEDEALTEEDVRHDIEWAMKWRRG